MSEAILGRGLFLAMGAKQIAYLLQWQQLRELLSP
jgi:hypothetical protein